MDIEEFDNLINNENISVLNQAIDLYTGEFLEGFYDDWVFALRERLREEYLQILGNILVLDKKAGHYQNALTYGKRILQEDPLQEEVHRELMCLYMALEQPQAALSQFERCCEVLRNELNTNPSKETIKLYEEISQRVTATSSFEQQMVLAPSIDTPSELFMQNLPLIGREEERRIIIDQIDDKLFTGEGCVVQIEGEAGVGKTRLMEEIARDVEWRGAQVLWGRGREKEVSLPFGPLVDAINDAISPLRAEQLCQVVAKPWLQVLKPFLPDLEVMLPQLQSAPALDANQEQNRLLEAIVRFLGEWVKISPLVVILEDLHWFDRDTMDLLPALVSRVSDIGLLLIITYRGEEARMYPPLWEKLQAIDIIGRHTRLFLPRLSASATSELIRRYLGIEREAPIFESRLYQETEGNPLFVLETLRTLYAEGLLIRDIDGDWRTPWDETTLDYAELPLPQEVERVIVRR
ncbi:MAG: AAA family ATPase, partial [Anaerolineales bacterium]